MNIKKIDDLELLEVLSELADYFDISDNYNIYTRTGETLSINFQDNDIFITYPQKASLLRALSLASLSISKNDFKDIEETLYFDECGVMLDLSRNGVMTVEAIKKYATCMALMGLNQLYMYMEDTYEVEGYPYFGYMRGRYTYNELKEIDDYCYKLGIEVIPHIQTLGHMEQYLKWDEGIKYRDTVNILLSEDEATYEFIKALIKNASKPFRTNKIHLGLDEAGNLGTGVYYKKHGPCDRKEILLKHLKKVCEIAENEGLIPIVYGDTIYSVTKGGGLTGEGEEGELSLDIVNELPKNLIPVYWNYYSEDYNLYEKMLKGYKKISDKLIFWGGIWNWLGFVNDGINTIKLSEPALRACKNTGIKTVIGSVWADDGSESSHFFSLQGAMYYAEHMYNETVDNDKMAELFSHIVKTDYNAFIDMSFFHNDYDNFNDYKTYHDRYFGKRYFWADILIGLLDEDLNIKPMSGYYKTLSERYKKYVDKNDLWHDKHLFVYELINTLSKKCYILENLKKAYDNKDLKLLEEIYEKLYELKKAYEITSQLHEKEWRKNYKPFGFEVLDARYGMMLKRIDTAIKILRDYLDNKTNIIYELEEERLLHRCEGRQRRYKGIFTASDII